MNTNHNDKPIRILIIEDSAEDRYMYRRLLERSDDSHYHIHEVDCGEDGLQYCKNVTLDCILLDYSLPDMSGIEVLEALGENRSQDSVAVVMLTGRGDEALAVKALKSGANDYIVKGSVTQDLLESAILKAVDALREDVRQSEVREELIKATITDELTLIYNRRFVIQRFDEEVERAERYNSPLSILLLDIDHFKRVNDKYGHQAGDEVLRIFASLLSMMARTSDIFGRYGGEEFLMLLPGTEIAQARRVAERCCEAIRAHPFIVEKEILHISCSIGVSEFAKGETDAFELLKRADTALYMAKDRGRNQVQFAL